jgi:hypothetical protein
MSSILVLLALQFNHIDGCQWALVFFVVIPFPSFHISISNELHKSYTYIVQLHCLAAVNTSYCSWSDSLLDGGTI